MTHAAASREKKSARDTYRFLLGQEYPPGWQRGLDSDLGPWKRPQT